MRLGVCCIGIVLKICLKLSPEFVCKTAHTQHSGSELQIKLLSSCDLEMVHK